MLCKEPLELEVDPDTLEAQPKQEVLECISRDIVYYPEGRPIHPIEVAYLLYIGRCVARIGDKILNFREFMVLLSKRFEGALAVFEVYYDLRKRGRLPVPAHRENCLWLIKSRRKPRVTHIVVVLEGNRPVTLEYILEIVEESRHNGWEPILAIVDRYGDITYYTPMVFHPQTRLGELESLETQNTT